MRTFAVCGVSRVKMLCRGRFIDIIIRLWVLIYRNGHDQKIRQVLLNNYRRITKELAEKLYDRYGERLYRQALVIIWDCGLAEDAINIKVSHFLRNINLSPLINIGDEKSRFSQEAFNKGGTLNMLC